ncbi:hypothetical protein BKA70DRAFT_292280 [Coprinopsis sp. MPI-PUGE-AT-0042]|nr:hypothetical protein BKA70DRAFT_292280 [Coprinopsis sp. MPI-PUGE-AT-0042]
MKLHCLSDKLPLPSIQRCDLKTVALFGNRDERMPVETPLQIGPEDGLGRFLHHDQIREHITSLHLSTLNLDAFAHLNRDYPILFPSVSKLSVDSCEIPLSWIVAAAPSIRTLDIDRSRIYSSKPFCHVAFPLLVRAYARYDQVIALVESNALVPQNLRCLRLQADFGRREYSLCKETTPFASLRAASRLRSLMFEQTCFYVSDLPWWQAFGEALPPSLAVPECLLVGGLG